MNKITKKSFYSFLALYLISSFIFLTLSAYWFYNSQKAMEMSNNFYKMNHIADTISSDVIHSAMTHTKFTLKRVPRADISLFNANKKLMYGSLLYDVDLKKEYYLKKGAFTLITQRTANHLGIKYVVVQSSECLNNIKIIQNRILYTVIMVALTIIVIAVLLSYIFLKPIKDKMHEIETFVKDTTHELNTPISALMMSASRVKKKKSYDERTINNISISTKQLYDIYSSLSYLSFDNKSEEPQKVRIDEVVSQTLDYFSELLQKKRITVSFDKNPCETDIAPTKAKMLINNLLSNAIKYSKPKSKIYIKIDANSFIIEDEGIGIKKEHIKYIFERFVRANSYAGGFGVGLNIVQSIVNEYNFKMDIESQEGVGTKIVIKFKGLTK